MAALPVAVEAKTFVRARSDSKIAIRIGAEVPVIGTIMVGTSCKGLMRTGTRRVNPSPSAPCLHERGFI